MMAGAAAAFICLLAALPSSSGQATSTAGSTPSVVARPTVAGSPQPLLHRDHPSKQLQDAAGPVTVNSRQKPVYRITTVVRPPFIIKVNDDKGNVKFEGYCIDLINEIQKIVQFEYVLSEAPDGEYGFLYDESGWFGMVQELLNNQSDIALSSFSVTPDRQLAIDFTVPFYEPVGIAILMKKHKTTTSFFRFLTVLKSEVWGFIALAYVITSLLLFIFDKISPYSYRNNREKYIHEEEKREFGFKECFWFCMTSLTPQGGGSAPKNVSGQMVAAGWWIFSFIVIASYTANLAAFLTVSRLDTSIQSLDDLNSQYKVQYAPVIASFANTYFLRMYNTENVFYHIWLDMSLNKSLSPLERSRLAVWEYPVSEKFIKMYQSLLEAKLPENEEIAVQRVRDSSSPSEGFAFIAEATQLRHLVLTNCDLQMVGKEFGRAPYAIGVQKGSPLKGQLDDAILTLMHRGTLQDIKERWWHYDPATKGCEGVDGVDNSIGIGDIGGVFTVIFVGIGLACVTLLIEYCWYTMRSAVIPPSASSTTVHI